MTEFWKSNPKKFCDYCKVWITNNKPSIAIHESGKMHKDKVKAKLEQISKNAQAKKVEAKKNNDMMAAIEQAALQAMKNDLESNPSLKNYGVSSKSDFQSSAKPAVAAGVSKTFGVEKSKMNASPKPVTENRPFKRKAPEFGQTSQVKRTR